MPPGANCEVEFISSLVTDRITGETLLNPRASSFSVFDQYLRTYDVQSVNTCGNDNERRPVDRIFTLNKFSFNSAHTFLLHRAVSYSAGLIDHFFRGRIEINPPDEGVYGILDHSAIARHEFTRIKLKAKNVTRPLQTPSGEQPQEIGAGKLHAVALYTLNPCYQDDLSGEINQFVVIPSGCTWAIYTSGAKEISVSQPIAIDGLSSVENMPFTFDFSDDPIPINVRDLILQVVYTEGVLGEEQDAIAVGTVNLSEPTYLTVFNNTDYFAIDGELHTPEEIRSDPELRARVDLDGDGDVDDQDIDIDPVPMHDVRIAVDDYLTGPATLQPKNYFRIAVLTGWPDRFPFRFPVYTEYRFPDGFTDFALHNVLPLQNQLEREPTRLSAIARSRGFYHWYLLWIFKSHGDGDVPVNAIQSLPDLSGDPGPTPITVTFN